MISVGGTIVAACGLAESIAACYDRQGDLGMRLFDAQPLLAVLGKSPLQRVLASQAPVQRSPQPGIADEQSFPITIDPLGQIRDHFTLQSALPLKVL